MGITKKEDKKYICIRENDTSFLIQGEDELIRTSQGENPGPNARYFEVGSEVKIETTVKVVNAGTVYRESSYVEGTR